jgi:proline racemase
MAKSYVFLDESGDLGFDLDKKRTSRFFVITFLCCANKKPIEKVVSKCHSELKKQHQMRGGTLHCYREKPITRQRLLTRLAEKDCSIMTVFLDKSRVYTKLQDEKDVLYNYVTNILLDRIITKQLLGPGVGDIHLVASRKETSKFLNENFKEYLRSRAKVKHRIDIVVEIKTPHEEKSLQAVDFVSWAIFRKQEYGDASHYELIKSKIVEENPLFP